MAKKKRAAVVVVAPSLAKLDEVEELERAFR